MLFSSKRLYTCLDFILLYWFTRSSLLWPRVIRFWSWRLHTSAGAGGGGGLCWLSGSDWERSGPPQGEGHWGDCDLQKLLASLSLVEGGRKRSDSLLSNWLEEVLCLEVSLPSFTGEGACVLAFRFELGFPWNILGLWSYNPSAWNLEVVPLMFALMTSAAIGLFHSMPIGCP